MAWSLARSASGLEAVETRVLSLSHGVVKVELRRKIPLPVVRMLATDVVGVEGEESLVRCHTRCSAVKQLHGEIELAEDVRPQNAGQGHTPRTMFRMESR